MDGRFRYRVSDRSVRTQHTPSLVESNRDRMNTFGDRYASLREDELRRLADDVKNLVPEARNALRAEFERRHLSVKTVDWNAHAPRPTPRRGTNLVGDAAGEHLEMERGRYQCVGPCDTGIALEISLIALLVTKGTRCPFSRYFVDGRGNRFWICADGSNLCESLALHRSLRE